MNFGFIMGVLFGGGGPFIAVSIFSTYSQSAICGWPNICRQYDRRLMGFSPYLSLYWSIDQTCSLCIYRLISHQVYRVLFSVDSIGGVVFLSLSSRVRVDEVPIGALWAVGGALLYATYLVLMRRRAENEDKLNMPMFFGKWQQVYFESVLLDSH